MYRSACVRAMRCCLNIGIISERLGLVYLSGVGCIAGSGAVVDYHNELRLGN